VDQAVNRTSSQLTTNTQIDSSPPALQEEDFIDLGTESVDSNPSENFIPNTDNSNSNIPESLPETTDANIPTTPAPVVTPPTENEISTNENNSVDIMNLPGIPSKKPANNEFLPN